MQFTTNLEGNAYSFVTHDGSEYLSVPCVAIVESVLNGDFVPRKTIAETAAHWNGRVATLGHPRDDDGLPISANSPAVLASAGLGFIWNARFDEDKLKVEVWLNLAKCERLGAEAQYVVDLIKNHQQVEVSTGYFAEMRPRRGVHNSLEYNNITEVIYPDHLAMLPYDRGACNWAMGCGLPRHNQQESNMDERTLREIITDTIRKTFAPITNQGRCACGTVQAQAEEEEPEPTPLPPEPTPVPAPEPPPVPTPVPQPPQPVPQPDADEDDEEKDKETVEVTTQQADTLKTFMEEHRISRDNLVDAIKMRNQRRQEWAETIKTHAGLTDEDIIGISDKTLEQLSKTYTAQKQETPTTITDNSQSTFFGRGLPVKTSAPEQVEPLQRPQVLVNKRDLEKVS